MVSCFALITNVRAIILCFCIAAACTGLAGKQYISRTDYDTYLTLWKFKIRDAGASTVVTGNIGDIDCYPVRTRIRGAAGCAIVSAIGYFFLLIMSIADLIIGHTFITTAVYCLISLITFAFGLTAWALVAVVYHHAFCSTFKPVDDGFKYGYGFPLLVSAWCALVLAEAFRVLGNYCYQKEQNELKNGGGADKADGDENDKEDGEVPETEEEAAARIAKRDAKRKRHAARREQQQQEKEMDATIGGASSTFGGGAEEPRNPPRVSFANAPDEHADANEPIN